MQEPTFLDIWNNLLLPLTLDIQSNFRHLIDCEFIGNHKEVKMEYETLKSVIKNRMQKHSNKVQLMDRHKIAAAFTIAIAKTPQFKINRKKSEKLGLGTFITDYVLAWNVGINIIKEFTIREENEKGNKNYVSLLEKEGFYYPETSETFHGSSYEVQAIEALYWTIEKNSRNQFGERTGVFFLANIFCLIEKYSKVKFLSILRPQNC